MQQAGQRGTNCLKTAFESFANSKKFLMKTYVKSDVIAQALGIIQLRMSMFVKKSREEIWREILHHSAAKICLELAQMHGFERL